MFVFGWQRELQVGGGLAVVNLVGLKMIGQSDESRIAHAVTSVNGVNRVEPILDEHS